MSSRDGLRSISPLPPAARSRCRAWTIERDHRGQPRGVDAGMGVDRDQRCILHRRQVERLAFLDEDRDRDLLHAAKEITGRGVDRVHRDRCLLGIGLLVRRGIGKRRHRFGCGFRL